MTLGALAMGSTEFTAFALLNLASNTILGFTRVSIFSPAMIAHRKDKLALTPFRYALMAAIVSSAILGLAAVSFAPAGAFETVLVAISFVFPVFQEWLRQRCIIRDRRWITASGEAAKLALFPLLVLIVGTAQPQTFQFLFHLSSLAAVLVMIPRVGVIHEWTPFKNYAGTAWSQTLDFAVGTLNSIVPLFVLGALGGGVFIGGFRLAQTFLGPLNLLFSASRTTLLADGATKATHSADEDLIRHGSRVATQLAFAAIGVVFVVIVGVALLPIEFSGVSHDSLLLGLIGVGLVSATSGWAGIHTIIMRMFGRNSTVTIGRTVLVVLTWIGFAAGYFIGGVDTSLLLGFAVSGVLYPVVFVIPAKRTYARIVRGAS